MKKQTIQKANQSQKVKAVPPENVKPDWSHACENCGAKPIVPLTGMCGPCTFGEADTAGGNW